MNQLQHLKLCFDNLKRLAHLCNIYINCEYFNYFFLYNIHCLVLYPNLYLNIYCYIRIYHLDKMCNHYHYHHYKSNSFNYKAHIIYWFSLRIILMNMNLHMSLQMYQDIHYLGIIYNILYSLNYLKNNHCYIDFQQYDLLLLLGLKLM